MLIGKSQCPFHCCHGWHFSCSWVQAMGKSSLRPKCDLSPTQFCPLAMVQLSFFMFENQWYIKFYKQGAGRNSEENSLTVTGLCFVLWLLTPAPTQIPFNIPLHSHSSFYLFPSTPLSPPTLVPHLSIAFPLPHFLSLMSLAPPSSALFLPIHPFPQHSAIFLQ